MNPVTTTGSMPQIDRSAELTASQFTIRILLALLVIALIGGTVTQLLIATG